MTVQRATRQEKCAKIFRKEVSAPMARKRETTAQGKFSGTQSGRAAKINLAFTGEALSFSAGNTVPEKRKAAKEYRSNIINMLRGILFCRV